MLWAPIYQRTPTIVKGLPGCEGMADVPPFDTLPDDLLCEIFLFCLPSNRWEVTPNPSKTPTILTLVCKRWRFVALAFPSLWSRMKLCPPKKVWKNRKVCQRTIENFRGVLNRAKSAPLSLMVRSEVVGIENVTIDTFLPRVLQVAASSLTRLILLAIPITQLGDLPTGMFPSLQSFVFCMVESGEDGPRNSSVVAFRDALSLRRVVLDATFFVYADTPRFALPWSQLTHFLYCDGYNPCTSLFMRHIIKQKPQLRWLGLDVTEDETEQAERRPWKRPAGLDFLIMDTVVTLALNFEWEIEYLGLFDWVDFPNLRTLRLAAMEADSLGGNADRFFAKLQTFKKLEYLSIQVEAINLGVLESILKSVPAVHTLHFFNDSPYGPIFQLLETKADILPHLHTLALVSWSPQDRGVRQERIPASGLQGLLEARTSGAHPTSRIGKLVVWGDKASDFGDEREFVQVIQKFVKSGAVVFECHVGDMEERNATVWMAMDPGSRGWEEAEEATHFLANINNISQNS